MEPVITIGGNASSDPSTSKDTGGKFKSVSCAPRDQSDPDINETKDFSC